MASKAVNITVNEELIAEGDRLVKEGKYANRSQLFQEALASLLKNKDAEEIGEQAKLLDSEDSEEWLEGELESWQEKY